MILLDVKLRGSLSFDDLLAALLVHVQRGPLRERPHRRHPLPGGLDGVHGHRLFLGLWDVLARFQRPSVQNPLVIDFLNQGLGALFFRSPGLDPPVEGVRLGGASPQRVSLLQGPSTGVGEPCRGRCGLRPIAAELRTHQCRTREQGGPKCGPADNCISRTQGGTPHLGFLLSTFRAIH